MAFFSALVDSRMPVMKFASILSGFHADRFDALVLLGSPTGSPKILVYLFLLTSLLTQ
jgi:hypothetical protein